jgi:hypothetical protein
MSLLSKKYWVGKDVVLSNGFKGTVISINRSSRNEYLKISNGREILSWVSIFEVIQVDTRK